MNELHIPYNRPVYVALVDPEGVYDDENREGVYQTTAGQTLRLPRTAVVKLNLLEPKPREEIVITDEWSGVIGEPHHWIIQKARADAESRQDEAAAPSPPASIPEPIKGPTPIQRTTKEAQPGLFDTRGTGTYGPMPAAVAYAAPKLVSRRPPSVPQIPANIAFREVSKWVASELQANNLQWTDKAQQAVVSTVFIAEYKAGRIGPWEREK